MTRQKRYTAFLSTFLLLGLLSACSRTENVPTGMEAPLIVAPDGTVTTEEMLMIGDVPAMEWQWPLTPREDAPWYKKTLFWVGPGH